MRSPGVLRCVRGRLGSVAAHRAAQAGSRSLSLGVFVSQAPLLSPVQHAMANMADITNSCSAALRSRGPAPRSQPQPFPRSSSRMRRTEARGSCRRRGPWREREHREGWSFGSSVGAEYFKPDFKEQFSETKLEPLNSTSQTLHYISSNIVTIEKNTRTAMFFDKYCTHLSEKYYVVSVYELRTNYCFINESKSEEI